ncbi:MAG: AAA family ATPase, partial [Acidobacteriota bacterium]
VIGRNGVGKSSLFDAFGFLADCLKHGVEEACDLGGRGGFGRLRSLGVAGPMEFEVYYKGGHNSRPITYELTIDADGRGRPFVKYERLRQRRKGQKHGRPFSFLILNDGRGEVWKGEEVGRELDEDEAKRDLDEILGGADEESSEREIVELDDSRRLGIATLGELKQHPRISEFRKFIEGWYLSYFSPDAARSLPLAGPQHHLNRHGDNLGNVVQFFEREHPERFRSVLGTIAEKIPGVNRIDTEKSNDGRLLLRFNDRGFEDPFYVQQMSDGTLKAFAYLLMLEDPTPPPFICIEEPENGLYHKLLESLAREFRDHATGKKDASQIFVTTHQPYFVDALSPAETWILEKGTDGFSTIRRASEDPIVVAMVAEGLPLGGLWYSDYLEAR